MIEEKQDGIAPEERGVADAQSAPAAEGFVLSAQYLSGPLRGQPQYFCCWTLIGPMATPDIHKAERFASVQEALQSPAYSHWSSFYEPTPARGGEP